MSLLAQPSVHPLFVHIEREERNITYLETAASADNLHHAYARVRKASGWKYAPQKYECNILKETFALKREILSGRYTQQQGSEFKLCEHGHLRMVRALIPRDMVAQHSLCDNVLNPELSKYIIHDNGASLNGKGMAFTQRRFEQHLRKFYKANGNSWEGYILFVDYRKFFDNIRHETLVEIMGEHLPEDKLMQHIASLLKAYEIDVSYSSDKNIMDKPFNSLEYQNIPREKKTGQRMMKKSLGIGAPISQISGIIYPAAVDSYCKTVLGLKFYDVYMDDRVVIHRDKACLKEVLAHIRRESEKLGLFINDSKTQIIKLTHGFSFLKARYKLRKNGRVERRTNKDVFTRGRRRLKDLARFVAEGKMTLKEFKDWYRSWRGDKKSPYDWHSLMAIEKTYKECLTWITQNRKPSEKSSRKFATLHQCSQAPCPTSGIIR